MLGTTLRQWPFAQADTRPTASAALARLVLAAVAVLALGGSAQAQFTINVSLLAPNTALTFNAFPDPLLATPFGDTFRWTDDTATEHLEIGQSFRVTTPVNWNVTAVVVPVSTDLLPLPAGLPLTLQFYQVLNASSTLGTPMGPPLTGVTPGTNGDDGYWRFNLTNPINLTGGLSYAFTIGYAGGPSAAKIPLYVWQTRQAPDPFPNGRAMFREGTPLNFVAEGRTPPYDDPTDFIFYVLGTGPQTTVPDQPVPTPGGIVIDTSFNRSVGGISIDSKGLVKNTARDEMGTLAKLRIKEIQPATGDLGQKSEMRKVSLRGIEEALARKSWGKKAIPDAVRYLGGLQRIQYVLVYPELQDIVLAGPAESWMVDAEGNVVGKTTGRPVMHLDDLLVALRSARQAAAGGITCSIDPTKEGLERLRNHASTLTAIGDPQATAAKIAQVLGEQQITLTGVPANSHFASVLVAADYRMKRIAMGFEPSPVRGLPSFLQMTTASGRGMSNMLPRWWLEPNYEPLLHDDARLAWEIRGASVKAMTEEDFLTAAGNIEHTGKANPIAQRWADLMTKHYDELAVAEPVFGELQNCIDLAVVAALIVKERLPEKAGCNLPAMLGPKGSKTGELPVPTTVESQASVLRKGRGWVISASGGVLVNSWGIASNAQRSDEVGPVRASAAAKKPKTATWWWD